MIVFDIEATDLIKKLRPIDEQPHIVEFAAVKLHDKSLKRIDEIEFMVDPKVPLPDKFTKITGIDKNMVKGKKTFAYHFNDVTDFFLGERVLCAHNISYDTGVLGAEVQRLGMLKNFPWPPEHVCTMRRTDHFTGKWLKLTELYKWLFEKNPIQSHRAMSDVEMLVKCVKHLRKMEIL